MLCPFCKNKISRFSSVVTKHLKKRKCPSCSKEIRLSYKYKAWLIGFPAIFLLNIFVAKPYFDSHEHIALSFFFYSIVISIFVLHTMVVKPAKT